MTDAAGWGADSRREAVGFESNASGNANSSRGDRLPLDLTGAVPGTLIADIALKPPVTPLMQAALARGLPVHAGIHMLAGQVDSVLEFFGLAGA